MTTETKNEPTTNEQDAMWAQLLEDMRARVAALGSKATQGELRAVLRDIVEAYDGDELHHLLTDTGLRGLAEVLP